MDSFEEGERKILYTIVQESPGSIAELSSITGEKEANLKDLIRVMKSKIDKENAQLLFGNLK